MRDAPSHGNDTAGEDGEGWTTIAVHRATRRCAIAHGIRQADTARQAHDELYSN
jgi:hypothetical protein